MIDRAAAHAADDDQAVGAPALRVLAPGQGEPERDWDGAIFSTWMANGRSNPKTAEACGVPLRSVQHHAKQDRWHERADKGTEELAADAKAGARVGLYHAVADAVAALAKIARGEGEKRTVSPARGGRRSGSCRRASAGPGGASSG